MNTITYYRDYSKEEQKGCRHLSVLLAWPDGTQALRCVLCDEIIVPGPYLANKASGVFQKTP